jgi:small GTP-binding protein
MSCSKPKVVLFGDSTVGKTCLAMRFKHNNIDHNFVHDDMFNVSSTIGCEFICCRHIAPSGSEFRLLMWDTAGQELYRSFTPQFSRNSVVTLILYDMSKEATKSSVQTWIDLSDIKTSIIIVPTKVDLCEDVNGTPFVELKVEGDGRQIFYAKPISSTKNIGIKELLDQICEVVESKKPKSVIKSISISNNSKKSSISNKCC